MPKKSGNNMSDNIKKGIMQYITIIKLCEKDNVENLIKKIQKSSLVINEQLYDSNNNELQVSIKDDYINSLITSDDKSKSNCEKVVNSNKLLDNNIKLLFNEPEISITELENGNYIKSKIVVEVENEYTRNIYKSVNNFINDMNLKGFNGDNLTYNAREFLLQPSIGKNNDKEYFINFKLSIWNSGYASIIQEHEIIDISANELSENGLSLIYNSYKLPLALHMENNDLFGIYEIDDNISNYDLNKMYAKAISNFIGKELDISDMASTLLLMDYDFKPKNMGDKNLIYQKSMCNLISSPIFKYNELSTDQRNKLVKNNSYVLNNYNEIYVSTNPKVIINSIGANENNLPNHNTVEIYDRVLLQGIIPAIEIVMLDKFIYKRIYNLLNKNISKLTIEELEEIEEEIYKYNVMLNELKTYNFDTLTKLVKFIEDTQTAGITKEYIINSIDDFNKIIKSKKQRRRDESNRIISIFVSVLTLLLSYTYIYDIINIVNDTFVINFDKLSIFRISLIIEIIFAIIFILLYIKHVKVFKKYNKDL